jgi:hypothetical protein
VLRAGVATALHAPPVVLVAEATFVNVVWPHAFASSETASPVAPFETAPDIVDCLPYGTSAGAALIETPVRTVTVPRRLVANASR